VTYVLAVIEHASRLLDRTLSRNQAHLRRVLREYEAHPDQHRPRRSNLYPKRSISTATGSEDALASVA
jgi:hypothetical protein